MSELDGTWVVLGYERDGEMIQPEGDAYLEIDGDRLGGTMGVNRVMGGIGPEGLTGPMASTLMAGPQHLMDQEYRLIRLLNAADRLVVDDSGMTWLHDGLTVVEFVRSGTDPGHPSS